MTGGISPLVAYKDGGGKKERKNINDLLMVSANITFKTQWIG